MVNRGRDKQRSADHHLTALNVGGDGNTVDAVGLPGMGKTMMFMAGLYTKQTARMPVSRR